MDGPPPANSGSEGAEEIKFIGTTPDKSGSILPPASSESPAELGVRVAAIESSVQQLLSALLPSNIPRPQPADSSVDSKGKAAILLGADSGEGSGAHSGSPFAGLVHQHAAAATGFPAAAPGPSDGARRVFPIELDDKPYLPVEYYGQVIADGFRTQPFHGTTDSKPHRFAIDFDETYKRIYDAFKQGQQAGYTRHWRHPRAPRPVLQHVLSLMLPSGAYYAPSRGRRACRRQQVRHFRRAARCPHASHQDSRRGRALDAGSLCLYPPQV